MGTLKPSVMLTAGTFGILLTTQAGAEQTSGGWNLGPTAPDAR